MTALPIDRVLDALHYDGPRDNRQCMCLCPAHDDHNPSLSIREDSDGKVLVYCFAGCDTSKVLAAVGLTVKDLSPSKAAPNSDQVKSRIVATYDYVDSEGSLLYQVVRKEPKKFLQRRKPAGGGKWVWSLKGVERVLYHLPELLASDLKQWVFLVEGEKDADNVRALGLVATTNAQGADYWEPRFNQWLAGRRMCILPDNDDAGRKHVQKVAPGLLGVAAQLRVLELPGLPEKGDVSDWLTAGGDADQLLALVEQTPDYTPTDDSGDSAHVSWPYAISDGRMVHQRYGKDDAVVETPIADFTARIVGELVDETGDRIFVIEGQGKRGGHFRIEVPSAEYGDTGRLIGLLESVSSRDPVHPEGRRHVGPAIKLLTGDDLWQERRYTRTGWANDRFLIPGREPEGVRIDLHRKLPYGIDVSADLSKGLQALAEIIQAPGAELGTLLVSHALLAPMAHLAGWHNERSGMFIKGRSGVWKTTTTQLVMAIYGCGFLDDDSLIRWGEGATRNAIMQMVTQAGDMPVQIDNYKANTGDKAQGFINLVHAIMEGSEKDRLNRSSELRESKPIFCWPIFTGEDIPDTDPASLARLLVLPFEQRGVSDNPHLTKAQSLAQHLSAVGNAWLDWLESPEGRAQARLAGEVLPKRRDNWACWLRNKSPNMVNAHRVATNIATNELVFEVALRHPSIGPMLSPFVKAYGQGITTIALGMGRHTAQSLEATRYLRALRELLSSGRAVLRSEDPAVVEKWGAKTGTDIERQKLNVIGWSDGSGGAYLFSKIANQAIKLSLGDDLGGMSENTLYDQLLSLGAIQPGKDGSLIVKKLGGDPKRVLHVLPSGLQEKGANDED
jgi:hypothetical protein